MAVPVRTTPGLQVGRAVALFRSGATRRWSGFDVTADGGFLAIVLDVAAGEQPVSVVLSRPQAEPRRAEAR